MNSKPHPILIAAALFLLALAVRLPKLDTYFTADEFLWVERSRNFLGGLLSPDFACLLPSATETGAVPGQGLACTLRTGHPGVVTMWTGAAGITLQWLTRPPGDARSLPDFVRDLPTNPVERRTIAPVRLPTVFLTALFVAGMYLLLRKMFRPPVPLLAGLLMALNPFHIALSRVLHHDALSTTFMLPAALSVMLYFGVERRRRWLALAGVLSGLAMLAKSTGLFLIPYAGLLGLWSLLAAWARGEATFRRALGRTLADGLLWAAIAAATFALFWPAMWVIPGQALHTIYAIGFKYASGGHAKGVFFLGNSMQDPGPLFYPVTWLFRTNLWQMAGLAAAAVALGSKFKVRGWGDALSPRGFGDHFGLLLWAAAFLFFFMLEMTLGEKKQGRYILPIYPMLDVVAAAGLAWLVRARRKEIRWGLAAAVLAVNLGLVVWSAPYYFAYYNPLAGGAPVAARAMTIGWGDGLDKAAAWLNSKPDAAALKVASWYGSTFAPYFRGETIRYSDQKGNALAGDYIVFYVNQRQRHYPDDEIWRTINDHFSLEKTIFLRSVPYAWIFPAPGIGHSVEDQTYTGIGSLLGWDWRGSPSPDDGPVAAGSALPVSVYWEYLGKTP
ncbi:MAG: ArnT family glycosyltransferase, partial [Anaerolineae bacterium]